MVLLFIECHFKFIYTFLYKVHFLKLNNFCHVLILSKLKKKIMFICYDSRITAFSTTLRYRLFQPDSQIKPFLTGFIAR